MGDRRWRGWLVAAAVLCAGCEAGGWASDSETAAVANGWQTETAAAVPAEPSLEPPVVVEGVVVSVVDGDTVRVDMDGWVESVRLIGIDTPETGAGGYTERECGGPEATLFLRGLLPEGEPVHVELGVEQFDRYGRVLGYVHRADDGLFVNLEVAVAGYADELAIPPNTLWSDVIAKAVLLAQEQQLGIWRMCGQ